LAEKFCIAVKPKTYREELDELLKK